MLNLIITLQNIQKYKYNSIQTHMNDEVVSSNLAALQQPEEPCL